MGRLHTHNHGKSHSTRPITLKKPSWITQTPKEIEEIITKYGVIYNTVNLKAEKGKTCNDIELESV